MKKDNLRIVRLEGDTEHGKVFLSSNPSPLTDGEWVKFDPEESQYYGKDYSEERAVIGRVGRVLHSDKPYMALGAGETYEEQVRNKIQVCLSWGTIEASEVPVKVPNLSILKGSPCDWLPGLDELGEY